MQTALLSTKSKRYLSPLSQAEPILQGPHSLQTPREPTKRALLIAINYTNLPEECRLKGPQREVEDFKDLLVNQYQYKPELITILTDKAEPSEANYPSREIILKHLRKFYEGQNPGDHYVFYCKLIPYFDARPGDYKKEDGKDERTSRNCELDATVTSESKTVILPSVDTQLKTL
ncbi:hypothetical protein C0992_004980, partial [Termitomyces sp. T32_za158]